MKIAITGATGFVGKYVVDFYQHEELTLFGRSIDRLRKCFSELEAAGRAHLVETDYSMSSLKQSFQDFDAIIHLSSLRIQKNNLGFREYAENIYSTENLINVAIEHNISNFIFASSHSVYTGIKDTSFLSEEQRCSPGNFYGVSKLACEHIANLSALNVKSLRLAQVVGLGEREGYMLSTFLNQAIAHKPITLYGQGCGRREYVYVRDVVSAIDCAIKKPEVKGVFNIGSGVTTSHRELAETINKIIAGGHAEILVDAGKSEDTATHLMDNHKAKEILGWEARFDLEEMYQDIKLLLERLK